MIKNFRSFLVVIFCVLLFGCQSATYSDFSMTQAQWQSLSEAEKSALMNQYNETHRQQTSHFSGVARLASHYPKISVQVLKGRALMWPQHRRLSFAAQQFTLDAGQCQVQTLANAKQQQNTSLKICYDGQKLMIDPSQWQKDYANASLIIHSNLLWQNGMTYPALNSDGYAQLKDTVFYVVRR